MRHGKKHNHLGRKTAHRHAMLSNMAASLILHKRIETTVAKAKELRTYVEPLLTKAKDDSTHSRRMVFRKLRDKEPVKELFDVVADKIADRPGGYTRIIKLGTRLGDSAETCMMELVDFNETFLLSNADKPTRTRRSRRGGKKSGDSTETESPVKAEAIDQEATMKSGAADLAEANAPEEIQAAEETVEVEAAAPTETTEVEETAEVAETPVAAAPEAAAEEASAEPDDLTKVEGIGPKIAEVLTEAGLDTFAKVADSTPEAIREIMDAAGSQYASHDPATWPQQAKLAADGKWDELKAWQDELDGGREN
ncbi:50S ribosomal protein L17 [Persicitalea sp.]|uniref:50S ribosomal protein L17 n=1 Tax=Persicitalea sp. TaxID=3100273 RepID=UPI003593AB20